MTSIPWGQFFIFFNNLKQKKVKNRKKLPEYMIVLQTYFGKRLEKTFRLKSAKPGPTIAITAGVHGIEHCGLKAFADILPTLAIERGEIIFAIGNPRACFKKIRAASIDLNLNRFGLPDERLTEKQKASYEYARATLMKQILGEADMHLDIHSGTALKEAVIICEPNSYFITRFFPRSFTHEIYGFDAIEQGAWDGYMLSLGKPGITIECGFHEDPKGPIYARAAVASVLATYGLVSGPRQSVVRRKYVQMFMLYHTINDTFTLARNFFSLEKLKRGEIIGHDGQLPVKAPKDCLVVFPHNCTEKKAEAFLLGREI